jgi:hypothetical protein
MKVTSFQLSSGFPAGPHAGIPVKRIPPAGGDRICSSVRTVSSTLRRPGSWFQSSILEESVMVFTEPAALPRMAQQRGMPGHGPSNFVVRVRAGGWAADPGAGRRRRRFWRAASRTRLARWVGRGVGAELLALGFHLLWTA